MTCTHSRKRLTVEVYQCEICGRSEPTRVAPGCSPTPATLIQQGLIDAESVIESMGLTGPDAEYLRSIERCTHAAKTSRTCQATGKTYEECGTCGRKWGGG